MGKIGHHPPTHPPGGRTDKNDIHEKNYESRERLMISTTLIQGIIFFLNQKCFLFLFPFEFYINDISSISFTLLYKQVPLLRGGEKKGHRASEESTRF